MTLPDARSVHRRRSAPCHAGWLLAWLLLPVLASAQTVQLAKTSQGSTGSYDFSMTNLDAGSESITTTVAGTPTTGAVHDVANPALPVTLSEAVPAGYQITDAACQDTSGTIGGNVGALLGATLTIAPANLQPGVTLVCTFVNAPVPPDLAISKQASPTVVASGGTVTYTLTATNNGTVDAVDAVLVDTPGAGLSCTTAGSCSAAGGATCPASLPASALFGAGVAVPNVPPGGSITVTFPCTVTASGL